MLNRGRQALVFLSHVTRETCEASPSEERPVKPASQLSVEVNMCLGKGRLIQRYSVIVVKGVSLSPVLPLRTIMNLKLYSKLASELCLNAAGAQTSQQGPQWRICSSNHGNTSGSHLPQSVISSVASHHSGATSGSCITATEDAEPPDIWAVIKPGHVREKIAMFGSDGRWSSGNRALSPGVTWDKDEGLSGLFQVRKSKGNWEENGRAKRQRHLGNQNVSWDATFWRHLDWSPRSSDGGRTDAVGEREELKVSVVEMVACLEKRFCQQRRRDAKPVLQKSSASLTLSRAPPTEPDSARVSNMVARLESDCLRTQMEANGLKRTVGRVLLATAVISSSPCQPTSTTLISLPPPQKVSRESTPASLVATPPPPNTDTPPPVSSGQETPDPEETEPPPGLLFRSPPPPETPASTDSARSPVPVGGASEQASGAEACAFLEARQRLRQLLEPRPLLTLLPHHLLVQIFALLPTRSLAALKCACRYFRFIINTYGVRPADSLWVSDPCYSDDPCKQCKKRYVRGDVSLCRWHHKPFCQALPYGPGYWMCCRGVHKDTPGCNVGLHDNRWVPAFHSRNVPICRWGKQEE